MSFRDMIDGGGMGRSGDKFEGGPFSAILNALGVKPLGYNKRQEAMQAGARPRPSYVGRPSSSGTAAPAGGPPLGAFDPAGAPSAGTIEQHRTSYNQKVAEDQARMFDMTQGAPMVGSSPRMGQMTAQGLPQPPKPPDGYGPPLGSQPGAPNYTLPMPAPPPGPRVGAVSPAGTPYSQEELAIAQYLMSRGALGPQR